MDVDKASYKFLTYCDLSVQCELEGICENCAKDPEETVAERLGDIGDIGYIHWKNCTYGNTVHTSNIPAVNLINQTDETRKWEA